MSYFPDEWKKAHVYPVFKKSDPSYPGNYRPISLQSCIGKQMKRCVHKYVYNFIVQNNILSPYQSGFVKGASTTNQLLYIYNDICKALDEGKEIRMVFCDISKAFNRVWHKGLMEKKLLFIGINGPLYKWFHSYLSNRKQRDVIRNSLFDWCSVSAGMPQGSILGPLL
jgi:hypothetical protein